MVTKRDGSQQPFSEDKIRKRIDNLLEGLQTQYMSIDICVNKIVKYAHSGKYHF